MEVINGGYQIIGRFQKSFAFFLIVFSVTELSETKRRDLPKVYYFGAMGITLEHM